MHRTSGRIPARIQPQATAIVVAHSVVGAPLASDLADQEIGMTLEVAR